ncbi:MarR family winged helix-turn-helix transcriptional regulator [Nocardia macrotermitis]|uniref:MarR family winged helix-turn-helix transcriptional regulator n=1 Tax=Nocardia macrotermitis TaxID=2585198 RepID=UPI0018863759|nr:MarR family transcriptional regulator [Nocardia macrotermitis]
MDDSTALGALDELARLLRGVSQELDKTVATCLGEGSPARWHVLNAVADGQGRSMSQLAEATQLNAATLTRLIDAMIADNLVNRNVDAADRRRVLVHATRRGQLTHKVMNQALSEGGVSAIAADSAPITELLTALSERIRVSDPVAL